MSSARMVSGSGSKIQSCSAGFSEATFPSTGSALGTGKGSTTSTDGCWLADDRNFV